MEQVPVLGIEEIVIEVSDLDRAVAFYQDVVGLKLRSRGTEEAWFKVGEQWLAVFLKGRAGIGPHFAFRVAEDEVERARQELEAQGVPVETSDYSGGASVYICDPDGNKIELHGKRV
uniref:VOC domain-containing protein n=1 Tax=uncultured Armatimonadetes bacterium TaxID=157466 RepID=A0A6J4I8A1_9BACT|nr:hypothetical protein AVDCRST_MAG63-1657 [uncultured Armatimonadetes bacterium]